MILFHTPRYGLERCLAMADSLALGRGHGAFFLFEENPRQPGVQTAIQEQLHGIIFLDPDPVALPEELLGIPVPKIFIYSVLYRKKPSTAVLTWHEEKKITSYWERVRPLTGHHRMARQIFLPPMRSENPFPPGVRYGKSRPLVGLLAPPLENQEIRQVQQQYIGRYANVCDLVILSSYADCGEMAKKTAVPDAWYLPASASGPIWSFELSRILLQGGTIVAADPPPFLADTLLPANDGESITFYSGSRKTPDPGLYNRLSNTFISSLEKVMG